MFLIKVSLGVSLVVLCCCVAKNKANIVKEKVYYFNSLILACDFIKSDLLFKKRNLNEILSVNYPSYDFLQTVNDYFIGKNTYPDYLTNEELVLIKEFFSMLGGSDANSQITALELFKTEFSKIRDDKKREYDKNYKVTLKVGFSIGIMLLVVVI